MAAQLPMQRRRRWKRPIIDGATTINARQSGLDQRCGQRQSFHYPAALLILIDAPLSSRLSRYNLFRAMASTGPGAMDKSEWASLGDPQIGIASPHFNKGVRGIPQERLPIRKIREVLRLKAGGFSKRRSRQALASARQLPWNASMQRAHMA